MMANPAMRSQRASCYYARKASITAVVLAAGRGSRLREFTLDRPKCLVEVDGHSLISRLMNQLGELPLGRIIVAVGYRPDQIRAHIATWHQHLPVTFVENSRFLETGSIYSLSLCLAEHRAGDDLLVVEGDVALDAGLLAAVINGTGKHSGSTLLAPYAPHLSGTFALVANGVVVDWVHESERERDFPLQDSYKTVNITLLDWQVGIPALRDATAAVIRENGAHAPLEIAMRRLVRSGLKISAIDVAGARWCEVDTLDDLTYANSLFGR